MWYNDFIRCFQKDTVVNNDLFTPVKKGDTVKERLPRIFLLYLELYAAS